MNSPSGSAIQPDPDAVASGGKLWKLMAVLMVITAVSSAVLDNVTTMLLMTPITIRIALALDTDPLALLLPEVPGRRLCPPLNNAGRARD